MKNYLQGDKNHPAHISVGAVVFNDKREVCTHHIRKQHLQGYWAEVDVDDVYILMRETMHPNESLESTLNRGLKEEFGIEGELVDYIGSIQSHFDDEGVTVEKTTLYFLVRMKNQDTSVRDASDIEGTTELEWHQIDFLIPKMSQQSKRFNRTDIDESVILTRVQKYLS